MRSVVSFACAAIVAVCTVAQARADSSLCPAKPYEVAASFAVYGSDTTFESLDLYLPVGQSGEPLMVFVHGGGWSGGDKGQYRSLGQTFAACGIAFAAVNYPLAPQARADAQAAAVIRALKWAIDNAASKGYARSKIFLMGHASGAQVAVLAGVDAKSQTGAALPAGSISGIIALDGMGYEPSQQAAEAAANPGRYRQLVAAFGSDTAIWKRFDVSQFLTGKEPRFLVVHGVEDYLASEAQSAQLVDRIHRVRASVTYLQPEGRDQNGLLVNFVRTPDDPTFIAIQHLVLGK